MCMYIYLALTNFILARLLFVVCEQNYGGRGGQGGGRGGYHGGQRGSGGAGGPAGFHTDQGPFGKLSAAAAFMGGGMTPAMFANQPQLMTHVENMQQMEPSELEHLFTTICSQLDPDLLHATLAQAGVPPTLIASAFNQTGGAQAQPNMGVAGQQTGKPPLFGGPGNFHNKGNFGKFENSNMRNNKRHPYGMNAQQMFQGGDMMGMMPVPNKQGGPPGMPGTDQFGMPIQDDSTKGGQSSIQSQKKVYQPKKSSNDSQAATKDDLLDQANPNHHGGSKNTNSGLPGVANGVSGETAQAPGVATPLMMTAVQMNLCQEHFPEPIMLFKERPLCKKCIQEEL